MKGSFEGYEDLSLTEQLAFLKDLKMKTKSREAKSDSLRRDNNKENSNHINKNNNSNKGLPSSSSSSSFSQPQGNIKNEDYQKPALPALPTVSEIIYNVGMLDYPVVVKIVEALNHPDVEANRQILDNAKEALSLKQENRAAKKPKNQDSSRPIIDDDDEETKTNTDTESAAVVLKKQLSLKKEVEAFVMVIICISFHIFYYSSLYYHNVRRLFSINQSYFSESGCFSKKQPFSAPAPASSGKMTLQPYHVRNEEIAGQIYELIHSESPYYDDRDTERRGQYKEMEEKEVLVTLKEKLDDDEISPKKARRLGLKEAMEQASSSSSTVESSSLKKNGGELEDANWNCILSHQGNQCEAIMPWCEALIILFIHLFLLLLLLLLLLLRS